MVDSTVWLAFELQASLGCVRCRGYGTIFVFQMKEYNPATERSLVFKFERYWSVLKTPSFIFSDIVLDGNGSNPGLRLSAPVYC